MSESKYTSIVFNRHLPSFIGTDSLAAFYQLICVASSENWSLDKQRRSEFHNTASSVKINCERAAYVLFRLSKNLLK